ncbi:MAG: hypothetical protein PHI12_07405 [Dehalococcoidales bacterium]|nr:hypothetical protein [Dehalococcoidales bacterium]
MSWGFLKTKWFWLNLIAIIILVIQYFVSNEMFPQYVAWEGLVLVVLNAIAGMIQSGQNTALKKQNAKLLAMTKK